VTERPTVSAWRGHYMDGATAALYEVALAVEAGALVGRDGADGAERLRWPADAITSAPVDDARTLLTCAAAPEARLTTSAEEVAIYLTHSGATLRARPRWQTLLAYGVGAVAVAALIYVNLDPLARAVARRIPPSYEKELGEGLAAFLLKNTCETPAARATLERLAARLGGGAAELHILDVDMVNAFTLPGGVVVVTRGLLAEAKTPDELAGVLAHELEHVKRRHVMIHVVRSSLLTFAWQATLGDYSGLFVIDPKTAMDIANLRFSREAEREADAGARDRLDAAGISRAGFRQFFDRMKAKTDAVPAWLSNHPSSADRAGAIGEDVGAVVRTPALSPADWATLRAGCAGAAPAKKPAAAQ
jgi:Zn-dependent protease with chaperone function